MKKKYFIVLLLTMILMPFKVFAAGGFNVSSTSVSMYPGETKTITISTNNAVGKLNISSSNGGVASVSTGSVFIQNPGASESITITGKSVGTTTISVVASDNFATMDEEILAGQIKTIVVNVKEKTTKPSTPSNDKPANNSNVTNNLSKNNNLKSISIEGYELVKVDNNNYTLVVSNNVDSVVVKAEAEDSKAKVDGNGTHKLKIGENKIEVIVTSESGSQNKINIKVTRKDGFYLEDLPLLLKDNKSSMIDIIINSDSKISSDDLNKIKSSGKIVNFNYYDKNKKNMYTWMIDGNKIEDTNELLTSILYSSEFDKEISKLSNYADGLYVSFKHVGNLPKGIKVKLYVGDKFEDGDIVNVYHYNKDDSKLEKVKDNLVVTNKSVELDVDCGFEYFVTMSNVNVHVQDSISTTSENSSINIFIIIFIVELITIMVFVVLYFVKIKPMIKEKKNTVSVSELADDNVQNITNDDVYNDFFK